MKTPKPGQFANINGVIVRAVTRKSGCKGCMFDNLFGCPRMKDERSKESRIDCELAGIIFKKI